MARTSIKNSLLSISIFLPIASGGRLSGLIGPIIGLIVLILLCALVITYVDRIVIRLYKATPDLQGKFSNSNIKEKTLELSNRAGVAMPSIFFTDLSLPGSFIIGKSLSKTTLVIPTRLLNLLNEEEIGALLAYNIVQINKTIRLRTLVALVTGISTMAASLIRWGAVFTGFGDYNDPAPKLFGLFIMGLVAPPSATLIHSVEQDYDAKAADLCKNHDALISAIERLESNNVMAYPSLGFLCLVDPQKESFLEYLFNIHPAKEIRIENLTGQIA